MNELIKTKGINFGLVFGLFLSSITLYAYVIDLSLFVSYWALGLVIVGYLVNGFWVIGSLKKEQEGFVTFKEGFSALFLSNAIGLLISTIISILIFIVIDPELQVIVKDLTIEKTTTMMENFGAPSEKITETIDKIKEQDNYSIVSQIKGYFMSLAVFSVFGLLIALIVKKKKEEQY